MVAVVDVTNVAGYRPELWALKKNLYAVVKNVKSRKCCWVSFLGEIFFSEFAI
jgi:hypothetical protein